MPIAEEIVIQKEKKKEDKKAGPYTAVAKDQAESSDSDEAADGA